MHASDQSAVGWGRACGCVVVVCLFLFLFSKVGRRLWRGEYLLTSWFEAVDGIITCMYYMLIYLHVLPIMLLPLPTHAYSFYR
ncbi:hypothetical protein F5Y09DRAFT_311285 [Xylaria sp. FL1042]|nr:hypothetical protein F5Y09DRAFT_311285 [Xylaria sp. FL1042]